MACEDADAERASDLEQPDLPGILVHRGNLLLAQGRLQEAEACYRRALTLNPATVEAHCNLGCVLRVQGNQAEAIACYRQAIALNPKAAEAHNNLGNALQQTGNLDEAAACYQMAIALKPDFAEAYNNLGKVHEDRGQLEQAIACYRRAVALKPASARIHSNLVYALHFDPASSPESIYVEHRQWNEVHAKQFAAMRQAHSNDPSPDRPLRVGYVSADFYQHSVGRFLLPLLGAHDREQFKTFCYASQLQDDAYTERLRRHAVVWRNVFGLDDQQLADLIRSDRIDILVDLSMHMAGNRLLVFARKPAPVQVTYLAYCSTTGLDMIDYRLTARDLDPPGLNDRYYSEQSVRLPETYWCYDPGIVTPAVNALPAISRGKITFGSLNSFCKVTPATLDLWSRLLIATAGSRLLLHCHPGSHRTWVREFLHERGIVPDRVTFADFVPLTQYFEQYGDIDIALDPFPYCGGTTTCDALWMGVPVISLVGQAAVSRSGLALLSSVGLAELAAKTPEEYLRTAAQLAADVSRLKELRESLRQRMRNSPLMDAPRFARHVEAAYRMMWRRWCANPRPSQ